MNIFLNIYYTYGVLVLQYYVLFIHRIQISRRPKIGAGYRIIGMITEPYKLIRECEVTAILILYSLPR